MARQTPVRTCCPHCASQYDVPAAAVGHRARCAACKQVFRVTLLELPAATDSRPDSPLVGRSHARAMLDAGILRPPTEDDILRWLAEAAEEDDDRFAPDHDDDEEPGHTQAEWAAVIDSTADSASASQARVTRERMTWPRLSAAAEAGDMLDAVGERR